MTSSNFDILLSLACSHLPPRLGWIISKKDNPLSISNLPHNLKSQSQQNFSERQQYKNDATSLVEGCCCTNNNQPGW